MADTPAQRQARRRDKLRAAGLTQMLVTIPDTEEAKQAVRELVAKIRKEYEE